MSIGVLHGQNGGAGLAVKVVGGTQRPSNGKQGIIWVNTDQKITSWTMQVDEPTEPSEGMVWVGILTSAKLNALKKNGIWFTPTSAKQYSDGAWVKKTGEYYNNGQWIPLFSATIHITFPEGTTCTVSDGITTMQSPDFAGVWECIVPYAGTWTVSANGWEYTVSIELEGQEKSVYLDKAYLYRSGDEYKDMTGGWSLEAKSYIKPSNANITSAKLTRNTDNLYVYRGGTSACYSCIAKIANGVDLSNYTTLSINCKCTLSGNGTSAYLVLVNADTDKKIASLKLHSTDEGKGDTGSTVSGTYRLSIPAGSTNVKVALDLYHYSNSYYNGYSKVWMYSLYAY